jgi:molecular chaperone GrpE
MEAKGADFDPDLHEAIAELDGGKGLKGKVIDVVQNGYYLNDKIIRFAKVVVGK